MKHFKCLIGLVLLQVDLYSPDSWDISYGWYKWAGSRISG